MTAAVHVDRTVRGNLLGCAERRMPFLVAAENRQTFFDRVQTFLPTLDPRYRIIERAYNDAKEAFREVLREGGERYFEHLRAVALILIVYFRVRDYELIVAALLHDIVEDRSDWTIERVRIEYGDRVALLVEWMTKPSEDQFGSKRKRDAWYHERFRLAPRDFFLIKLADRYHNLATLWAKSAEDRQRKLDETKTYYLPHAEEQLILLHELEEAIAELEK